MKLTLKLLGIVLLVSVFGFSARASAGVNDFEIQNYQIDYYLSRDTQNHSRLKTVETITALFPSYDQNHGIERAIPSKYDGHPVYFSPESVTSSTGAYVPYTTYGSNGNTVLRIGSADRYVHGLQTYKITYTEREVTKYFEDTKDDEFYWDTNGTEWLVPINSLAVHVHLDTALKQALNGRRQCYQGTSGSSNTCTLTPVDDGFTASAATVLPGENITVAIGFKPGTFAVYTPTLLERLAQYWLYSLLATIPLAVILIIWFLVRRYRRAYRIAEIGTIIPEYLPPEATSISAAGTIARVNGRTFSAQLIDLAVRGYLKIYQTSEKSFFRKANFEIEIVRDIHDLSAEEQELMNDIFSTTAVGSRLNMESLKRNTAVGVKVSDNQRKLDKNIAGSYGLKLPDDVQRRWFKRAALWSFVAAIVTLSPALLVSSLIALIIGFTLKPLTDKGLELYRYLKGLEMYIKVAEADRMRMLQSPEGALKLPAPVDTNDKRQLVKLYESVLPYAILFGQEKSWNSQLGHYYETTGESPYWYSGTNANAFNAAAFSNSISSFNQAASYSSAGSSSSGGSGGGGSSGGGGGGGGGGGW